MKRFLPTLRRIHRMGEKAKREYVKRCDRQFIDCVSECAKNVLKGNVPLSNAQMSKLRPRRQCAVRQEDVADEEAQNYPERWFSLGTSCTRTVRTGRSAAKVMHQTKKN